MHKNLEDAIKKYEKLLSRFENALKFEEVKVKKANRIPERLSGVAKIIEEYK